MKKALNRTIILLIILNLITTNIVLAQDVIEEENKGILETQAKEGDLAQKEAEIAAKTAEQEAKIAQEQMKAAEKQIFISRDQVGKLKDKLEDLRLPTLPKIPFSHLQRSGGGILVIPTAQMKLEDLAEITEDMNVMSRIFDNQLNQTDALTAGGKLLIGFNPYFGRDNNTPKAIYLEDYGALFFLIINMQLSAPPEEENEQETAKEETDPVWSKVRQEMYEPEKAAKSRTDDRPEEKYDAEKVEILKTNLIKTMKHATNIRSLQSEQLVILTVIGEVSQRAASLTQTFSYRGSTGSRRIMQTLPEVKSDSLQPTVLTICAKKSDIDAFAKGHIDYDQFRKRTGIFKSYAKAGQQSSPSVKVHQVAQEGTPY